MGGEEAADAAEADAAGEDIVLLYPSPIIAHPCHKLTEDLLVET